MRVLHLGANTASQMDVIVAALNRNGVEARGLCYYGNPIQSGKHIEILSAGEGPTTLTGRIVGKYRRWKRIRSAIRWAEIVHYYVGPRAFRLDLDLWYTSRLHKARLVEFLGSDIRTDVVAAADNPYLRSYLDNNQNAYTSSYESSRARQQLFARYGFCCATSDPELTDCLMADLFPTHYLLRARIDLSAFRPEYPSPRPHKLVLVHMPSNPNLKGTAAVLSAVERLKRRFSFDFHLLQGLQHDKALDILKSCDLLLDQFVIGTHGVASIEAMAFGKPVVSYIKPAYLARLPESFPIVPANQDNLFDIVASLLSNPEKLNALGKLSRAYVEKYHCADSIARQLHSIYIEMQTPHPGGSSR